MATLPQQALQFFSDLVFPARCVVCERVDRDLCEACIARFEPLAHDQACPICAEPATGGALCESCHHQRPAFHRVTSAFLYTEPMKTTVYAYKYKGYAYLTRHLVQAMIPYIRWPTPEQGAWLCAVPLSEARMAQRGFNQAERLMHALAAHTAAPMLPPASLLRTQHTIPLLGLNPAERYRRLAEAFHASAEHVAGRVVILVDDICTTGATLHWCAVALRQAGAGRVYGVTLARTPKTVTRIA